MSEVHSQRSAPRGRGSTRGGRGSSSYNSSTRGGYSNSSSRTNGDSYGSSKASEIPLEEQGEMGKLKAKYASQLDTLKEMFPSWTDEDLVPLLDESQGDLQQVATMISEGLIYSLFSANQAT